MLWCWIVTSSVIHGIIINYVPCNCCNQKHCPMVIPGLLITIHSYWKQYCLTLWLYSRRIVMIYIPQYPGSPRRGWIPFWVWFLSSFSKFFLSTVTSGLLIMDQNLHLYLFKAALWQYLSLKLNWESWIFRCFGVFFFPTVWLQCSSPQAQIRAWA